MSTALKVLEQLDKIQTLVEASDGLITDLRRDLQEIRDSLKKVKLSGQDFDSLNNLKIYLSIDFNSLRIKAFNKKIAEIMDVPSEGGIPNLLGVIRVAKISGARFKAGPKYAKVPGFININITSQNSKSVGAQLSPFVLKNEQGQIFENVWQFAKFYDVVPETAQSEDPKALKAWQWKLEQHATNGEPNEHYKIWREAGMNFPYPVRRPVPKGKLPLCHIWNDRKLGYIDARKEIYIPLYKKLASQTEDYVLLKYLVKQGYKIQLLDFDGPATDDSMTESDFERLSKIPNFIDSEYPGSVVVNEQNWETLVNSKDIILGHGYVLAAMILGIV